MNSQVPIMLDYYDASKPSTELVTTFLDCEFRVSFFKAIYSIHCGVFYFLYKNTSLYRVCSDFIIGLYIIIIKSQIKFSTCTSLHRTIVTLEEAHTLHLSMATAYKIDS